MLKAMGTPINIMTIMIPRHINPGRKSIVYTRSLSTGTSEPPGVILL